MWCYVLLAVIALIYLYQRYIFNFWKSRGVDTPNFHYVVGNQWEQLIVKKNAAIILQDAYKKFDGYNYFGFYNAMKPNLVIRNPEIIGDILVKDFASFGNNGFDISEDADAIFGRNPFVLNGAKWKHVRQQATPTFSSGKIKGIVPLIKETQSKLIKYLEARQNQPLDLELLTKRFNAENVASYGFGLNGNSFDEDQATFVNIANEPIQPSAINTFKSIVLFIMPSLSSVINVGFFSKHTVDYLHGIIKETMNYRQENNIQRNDLLDEMRKLNEKYNDETKFNSMDMLGHAGGLVLDGIVTSALGASHVLYEIAKNQEVQDKLREEIQEILQKSNGELTYENINEMEYLDLVIKEGMRLHPVLLTITKRVTKPYTMPPMREDGSGPEVRLEVNDVVLIPLYSIQRDEKYFPSPETFDPERFNRENRDSITKNTYMPFGEGPRQCLGMRFALLQTKIEIVTIINHFKLTLSAKMREPVEISPASFVKVPHGGFWVEFSKI